MYLKVFFVLFLKETPIQTQEPQSAISLWIMAAVTGVLAFYSMLITAVFINYWVRNYYFPLLCVLFVPSSFLRLYLPCLPMTDLTSGSQLFFTPAIYAYPCYGPKELKHQVGSQASAVDP